MKLAYPLRAWQSKALGLWRANGQRGIVEVVTGGGKTIFAAACIMDFLDRQPLGQVFIIVPSIALADQWLVSATEEMGVSGDSVGIADGKHHAGRRLHIMVVNSARRQDRLVERRGAWMLVVDECHRTGGVENRRALSGTYDATLGLSATPERQYDDALRTAIIPVLGDIIFRYSLADARRDGVVAPFDLVNVRVPLLSDEAREISKISRVIGMKVKQGTSVNDEVIKALLRRRSRLSNAATMRTPVAAKLIERHTGIRTMVFHEGLSSAQRLCALLKERGHSAVVYHTGIGPHLRHSNLRLYRQGVYNVLISCRALDEGVNIPETEVAIIASSSATMRQRIQRLGRVLRPAPGKAKATVYSIYATEAEEERLVREAADMKISGTAIVRWMCIRDRT